MEIRHGFNDAAQGGGGEAETGTGPVSQGPGGAGEAVAEASSAQGAAATPEGESQTVNLNNEFDRSATGGQTEPSANRGPSAEDRGLSVAQAEAELEKLEAGRPEPEPREELRPPTHLVRIVNSEIERKREARISALRAYLEFAQDGPRARPHHTPSNSPEPAL